MKTNYYEEQVQILLNVLPIVASEKSFALKGGTAINFFYRDLPRLSVDIDLTYLPIEDRETSMININNSLAIISEKIKSNNFIVRERINKVGFKKLEIGKNNIFIKIEPNYILRGTVHPVEWMRISKVVADKFRMSASMNVLNFNDLYAGKICAALDRQSPRDLFDIKLLIENEGFSREIIQSFIAYLISNNRPINEMLNPHLLDIENIFITDFQGMARIPITLESLIEARDTLIKTISESLTGNDKQFLLSFKKGNPEWNLFELPNIENLPAIKWKLQNIKSMNKEKHKEQLRKLELVLN